MLVQYLLYILSQKTADTSTHHIDYVKYNYIHTSQWDVL